MKNKKLIIYSILIVISLVCLIGFIFLPIQKTIINTTISDDGTKIIYIIKDESYFLGKSINEWGIVISTIGVVVGLVLTYIEYRSNKKRTEQEKGAEIAKMFATEIITKLSVIIQTIGISKLNNIIKKVDLNISHTYSIFECSNFDRKEMRKIYGEDLFQKYDSLKKEKELQAIYMKIIISKNLPYYSIDDIKKELSYMHKLKQNKSKNYKKVKNKFIKVVPKDSYFSICNTKFPTKFNNLIYDTLNELEYLCMYISSKAANSEFIYQSLHKVFLDGIRLLAIEISYSNTNSADKLYTNIIHVYNDWLKRYLKAQKKEEKNIKKSDKIIAPDVKSID